MILSNYTDVTLTFEPSLAGRFDVAERAVNLIALAQPDSKIAAKAHELRTWYQHKNRGAFCPPI